VAAVLLLALTLALLGIPSSTRSPQGPGHPRKVAMERLKQRTAMGKLSHKKARYYHEVTEEGREKAKKDPD